MTNADGSSGTEVAVHIHGGLQGVYFDRSAVCDIDGRAGELGLDEGDTSTLEED